jgi:hypothetical protein
MNTRTMTRTQLPALRSLAVALATALTPAPGASAQEPPPTPAPAAPATAPAATAPLPSPKAVALAFAAAVERGDAASAKALVTPEPAHATWAESAAALAAALKRLDDAAVARFGEGGRVISQNRLHMTDAFRALDQAQEKVDGETATVTAPRQVEPLRFRRVNGLWLLVPPLPEPDGGRARALSARLARAAVRTADEIAAGAFTSAAGAARVFAARVLEARLVPE